MVIFSGNLYICFCSREKGLYLQIVYQTHGNSLHSYNGRKFHIDPGKQS